MIKTIVILLLTILCVTHAQTSTPEPTTPEQPYEAINANAHARIRMLRGDSTSAERSAENQGDSEDEEDDIDVRHTPEIIKLLSNEDDAIVYPALVVRKKNGQNTLFIDEHNGETAEEFLESDVAQLLNDRKYEETEL